MATHHNSKSKICNAICFFIISLMPAYAYAQKLESVHKDWTVLTTTIDSNKVCYIASLPTLQEGNVKDRKDSYILVNLFPERKAEISFSPGFALQQEKAVKVNIEGEEHELTKIKNNIAWTQTVVEDEAIVEAMKKGIDLNIRADGQNGSYAIDTYSLKGFTAAFENMIELCSEKPEAPAEETKSE